MRGPLKLLAVGAVVVVVLAYMAPTRYMQPTPETVGQRADRVCSREYTEPERVEWCKNAVLLQAVADREAAKAQRIRQDTR